MSIETWKSEFYPKPTEETSPEEAISNSLKKWEGLRQENIQKHSVKIDCCGNIYDDGFGYFSIDYMSCSLCHHYYEDIKDADEKCVACPLSIVRGGVSCDNMTDSEYEETEKEELSLQGSNHSPWKQYTENKNPELMIFWLRKALTEFCGK